ncbi:hypothetical protein [Ornithinibacillus contaminans]|uniref:hypothetical protein n=1 Tax=Ornithinibacillus contaminans TaxID=694055 RepID=UPI00064DDD07|nr:hypothetical protein [Ornithinibacillus contaminans]
MEEKKNIHHDQAKELREILQELQSNESEEKVSSESQEIYSESINSSTANPMNILNLPPRSEVHGIKKKRTRLKIRKPFIRLSMVAICLLVVALFIYLVDIGLVSF